MMEMEDSEGIPELEEIEQDNIEQEDIKESDEEPDIRMESGENVGNKLGKKRLPDYWQGEKTEKQTLF